VGKKRGWKYKGGREDNTPPPVEVLIQRHTRFYVKSFFLSLSPNEGSLPGNKKKSFTTEGKARKECLF
jgi:hypothetical protein